MRSSLTWIKVAFLVVPVITSVLIVRVVTAQAPQQGVSEPMPGPQTQEAKFNTLWSQLPDRLYDTMAAWDWAGVRNVLWAFVVGILGASAFYFGVHSGFIARSSRARVLEFLADDETRSRLLQRAIFVLFGGIIAAVFQWAQYATFAPIQAFVLGATWPSVVTRVMSGESPTLPSDRMAEAIVAQKPAVDKGDAEAVIEG